MGDSAMGTGGGDRSGTLREEEGREGVTGKGKLSARGVGMERRQRMD